MQKGGSEFENTFKQVKNKNRFRLRFLTIDLVQSIQSTRIQSSIVYGVPVTSKLVARTFFPMLKNQGVYLHNIKGTLFLVPELMVLHIKEGNPIWKRVRDTSLDRKIQLIHHTNQ